MILKYNADSCKFPERRTGRDRRHKPTNPFNLSLYSGRRKTIRRKADRRQKPCTDLYSQRMLLTALLLILLCVADAIYTILHVYAGRAVEMNFLMNVLLEKGPFIFFGIKFILSACCIILLVLYSHHPLARTLIPCVVIIYSVVFCYQIFFFFHFTGTIP